MSSTRLRCLATVCSLWSATHVAIPAGAEPPKASESEPYSAWHGKRLGTPSGIAPIGEPGPELADPETSRKSFELGASAQVAQKLCSSDVDSCTNGPGFGFQAELLFRTTPLFAWGFQFSHAEFEERFRSRELSVNLNGRGVSGLLIGRVAVLRAGVFDPYVQAGFGGGSFAQRGELSIAQNSGTERTRVRQDTLAPVYQVSAGLDFHVTESLRVGGVFTWTHWLLSDFERCTDVAFGVCSGPGPGRLDLANAVWSLGARTSVAFGQSL